MRKPHVSANLAPRRHVSCPCGMLEALEGRTMMSALPLALHFDHSHITPHHIVFPIVDPVPVTPAPVSLTIYPTAGTPFTGNVGAITGLSRSLSSRLKARIDWGDSTKTTPGHIYFDAAGTLHVRGTHTYAAAGTFAVTVSVVLNPPPHSMMPSRLYTINSTAQVAQEATDGVTIHPLANVPFSGVVGTFRSTPGMLMNAISVRPFLKAQIDWGDGVSSTGTLQQDSSGRYSVRGDHAYASVGTFKIAVMVTEQYRPLPWPWPGPIPMAVTLMPPILMPQFVRVVARIASTALVTAPPLVVNV